MDRVECGTTGSEFDVFAGRPVQSAVLWSRVIHNSPVTPVDQSDLGIVISGDAETCLDLDIHMSVRVKFVALEGSALDTADRNSVVKYLLFLLFNQCSVSLNMVLFSTYKDTYNYRAKPRDPTHKQ
jgi:hypothetical protein